MYASPSRPPAAASASSTLPVSGGGGAAAQQKLLVMVGGEDQHLAACRPVFDTFADPVVHLGPLGSGQMAKLVNNLVFTALVTTALETFAFADELGMDRAALAQVLANGSGGSRAAAILAGSGFDISGMSQAVGNLQKDVRIVLDVARGRKASEPAGIVVPPDLQGRARWFEAEDGSQIHLGIDPEHRPAAIAHTAIEVDEAIEPRLDAAGIGYKAGEFGGVRVVVCDDPAGNHWELRRPV